MVTKKTQQPEEGTPHADETAKDKEAAPESTSTATATEADAGTTSAATEPPAPAADETDAGTASAPPEPPEGADGEAEEPLPDQTVLILRDETIGGKDYRPGQTPKLPGTDVAALVARKAGDTNPKAIAAARKARKGGKDETVIE